MGDGMLGALLSNRSLGSPGPSRSLRAGRFLNVLGGCAAALVLGLQPGCSSQRAAIREPVGQAAPQPLDAATVNARLKAVQVRMGQLVERRPMDEPGRAELLRIRAELLDLLPVAPRPASVHFILSGILMLLGDKHGTLEQVERAIALAPEDPAFHRSRGILLSMEGRPSEGVEEFQKTVTLDPQDVRSWQILGQALLELNRLPEAEAAARKALERHPDDIELLETLGVALSQQDKREEALGIYQKTITLDPKSARGYYNLGQTYQLMGRYQESRTAFLRVVEKEPDDYRAHSKLVQLNQALGDLSARDRALETVYALYRAGKIQSERFCREQTTIGPYKLMIMEHFELKGPLAVKYVFHILDESGNDSDARLSLGSYEVTNKVMDQAGSLPAGTRLYHLDYYRETKTHRMHSTFGFFKGAPGYDELRKIVEDVLLERRPAMSSSTVPIH